MAIQLKGEADVKELLARSVAAKNELHNIRGYSPNQWSFGRGGTQLGQYLRYENPVHDSARDEDQQFEQDLQRTALALSFRKKTFFSFFAIGKNETS